MTQPYLPLAITFPLDPHKEDFDWTNKIHELFSFLISLLYRQLFRKARMDQAIFLAGLSWLD